MCVDRIASGSIFYSRIAEVIIAPGIDVHVSAIHSYLVVDRAGSSKIGACAQLVFLKLAQLDTELLIKHLSVLLL